MGADTKDVDFRIAVIEEAIQLGRTGELAYSMKVCIKHEISLPTLYLWMRKVKGLPRSEWATALQVRHGGGHGCGVAFSYITPEAWEYFLDQYRQCVSCQAAYKACVDRAQHEGWKVPSLTTLRRRLARENLVLPARRRCFVGVDI